MVPSCTHKHPHTAHRQGTAFTAQSNPDQSVIKRWRPSSPSPIVPGRPSRTVAPCLRTWHAGRKKNNNGGAWDPRGEKPLRTNARNKIVWTQSPTSCRLGRGRVQFQFTQHCEKRLHCVPTGLLLAPNVPKVAPRLLDEDFQSQTGAPPRLLGCCVCSFSPLKQPPGGFLGKEL